MAEPFARVPDASTLARANLTAFLRAAGVASYEELLRRADLETHHRFEHGGTLKG